MVDSVIKMFCVSTTFGMILNQFTASEAALYRFLAPIFGFHEGEPTVARRVTCPKDGEDETLMKRDQTDGLNCLNHHLVVKTTTHYNCLVVWNMFYFLYWEYSSQRTNIFQIYSMGKLSTEWIDVRLMLVGLPADLHLMLAA